MEMYTIEVFLLAASWLRTLLLDAGWKEDGDRWINPRTKRKYATIDHAYYSERWYWQHKDLDIKPYFCFFTRMSGYCDHRGCKTFIIGKTKEEVSCEH